MTAVSAKDYVLVEGGLYFAIVSDDVEQGRILSWLRYLENADGMHKLNTDEADKLIRQQRPDLLFHSQTVDTELHGIPLTSVVQIFKPQQGINQLLTLTEPDAKQIDAIHIIRLLIERGIESSQIGLTGSLLLDAQHADSDVDLVIYGRDTFFRAREIIARLVETGQLNPLRTTDWREAYQRRDCSLSFDDYCLHEQRKMNKCLSGDSKVDISMIPDADEKMNSGESYKKRHYETLTARVLNDRYAYDLPARFFIDAAPIDEILVTTATYIGQAVTGEIIEARGMLEQSVSGRQRLVVGTSREATGEYLKVIKSE